MNVEEVLKVVEKINDSMTEVDDSEVYEYYLTCEINYSNVIFVKFLGISLYTNAEDYRKYIEEIDEYEELEIFLIRSIQKILKKVNKYYKNIPIIF